MRLMGLFAAVIATFTVGTSAIVWSAMTTERRVARQAFANIAAAEEMLTAVVARESALRGYAQTRRQTFLEPYDDASHDLAAAADRAAAYAADDDAQQAVIAEQLRLASRWAASANDAIIRVRNGGEIALETALLRRDLIQEFRLQNEDLRELVAERAERKHREAVEHAVLLVALLAVFFTIVGSLLARSLNRAERRRAGAERAEHDAQREFAETLQVTEHELEAHTLVKRHLERAVPGSSVVVLNRNNSQNRLEASTEVDPDSPLAAKLVDSSSGSCLAVRLGRTYTHGPEHEPLLACALCAHEPRSTCVPSLVSGEVIGSVLVAHPDTLEERQVATIAQSVGQASPVLANLRNLAVAEIRAATDGLTGLPNARSLRESLVRMVAQAARSELPLTAVLCDLDHFKQINDVFGHDQGDAALAAAATALRAGLREADVVGRYGGEEFLILLPDTPRDGGLQLAEKLRAQVAGIDVPGVARTITASFGVASYPADAPDGDMLVRMADRALYAAKAQGRNCVVAAAELLADAPEPG